jgi:hypothetical protein
LSSAEKISRAEIRPYLCLGNSDTSLPIVHPNGFSPDLLHRLRTTIERDGYCIFGVKEMERLLSGAKNSPAAKAQALHEFAAHCGVEVKSTPHLRSAYFRKAL